MTTPRQEALAERWEAVRPRLIRVAAAVLSSRPDAEDVVSDCWPRLVEADRSPSGPVRDVEGWGVVAVSRRALDVLRSARRRRETYVGPWLPEPHLEPFDLTARSGQGTTDPADRVTLDEQVGTALLVVLETLTPAERVAFVLHDVFGVGLDEVARATGRSHAAVRQAASRARRHVEAQVPRVDVGPGEHARVLGAFAAATASGDVAALVALLAPDVVLTSDGGGQVSAARRPVRGADRVARFLVGVGRRAAPDRRVVGVRVDGGPGLAVHEGGRLVTVVGLTASEGRVVRVDLLRAPDKLVRLRCSQLLDLPPSRTAG